MKNTRILPKGMTRRCNVESGENGECELLVNVRERNESLEVVGQWKTVADVSADERVMLVDSRADVDYYFSVKGMTVYLHGKMQEGDYIPLGTVVCAVEGGVKWMQSVGDFVVIDTTAGRKYLHFNGNEYVELNRDALEPLVIFKAVNVSALAQKVTGRDFNKPYSRWVTLEEKDRLALQNDVCHAYSSLLSTARAKGGYVQPVVVRCAVRLWDDNYAWMSAPVIVGAGLQAQSVITAQLNSAMSAYGESIITANMYNIGATIIKSPSIEWQSLVKSIDVLVSEEVNPFVSGQIFCRCESSSPEHYISYGLQQRERAVALAEVINPNKWRVVARFTDVGALPSSATILRSALHSHSVTRDDVRNIINDVAWRVSATSAVNLNGRLCSGGHSKIMRNVWQSALYWGGTLTAQSCEVVVKVRLRTCNGEVLKVNCERYEYCPTALNPLVTFPDARAEHLEIKIRAGGKIMEWRGTLAEADEQGMAYFVNSNVVENVLSSGNSFSVEADSSFQEENLTRLSISRVGNPFVTEQCRTVGQGEVLGVTTVAKSIYSGVFGRYPVYAFSTDGIYAVAYKAKGDYKDAQLISHRRLGGPITSSGEEVYFVSSQGELCKLSGKDVRVLDVTSDVVQLQWINAYGELMARKKDDTIEVYMPDGRRYVRDSKLVRIFGDIHNALGQDCEGNLVNLNKELTAWMPISLKTYPMALNGGELIAPMLITANQVGSFAENAQINLLGDDGTKCEWRELARISLANFCCRRIEKRIYSHPCRLVKLKLTGNAATGTIINDYALKYN